MAVQMRNGFAREWPIVNHQAITILVRADLSGHLRGFQQQMPEQRVILGGGRVDARDWFLRHDQHMNRRRRANIAKRKNQIILINDVTGDFARRDFLEQRFFHAQELNFFHPDENPFVL
jgi:hypothetical protein